MIHSFPGAVDGLRVLGLADTSVRAMRKASWHVWPTAQLKGLGMDWVAVATVAAGFSNTALLIVVIWQVHALARQTRASVDTLRGVAHANTFMSAIEIDRFFADRPDLRARFYGDLDGVGDQAELHRTDAAAEMLLDQFMMASTLVGHMSPDLRQGWKRYITHVVMRSPALQSFWQRNQEWYTLIELDEIVKPAGEFKAPAAVADPS